MQSAKDCRDRIADSGAGVKVHGGVDVERADLGC
jgi:hypothetical protein